MSEDKVQKSLVEVWNRYGMQKAARKSCFFFLGNDLERILERSQSVVEGEQTKHRNWS